MRRIAKWLISMLLLLGAALCAWAAHAQTLTVHYQARPPYSSLDASGQVVGLVATPVAKALSTAGIAFQWAETPSQRQLALIQSGRGLQCGVGWFRNDERAAKGKFSRPLYRDRPFGALVRDDARLASGISAATLLADTRHKLLVKDGYSYGPVLDGLLKAVAPKVERTSVDPPQMSLMLQSRRADWMIVAPEEAAVLAAPGLHLISFDDVPAGSTRHLYCSDDVPDEWMARIDGALTALPR